MSDSLSNKEIQTSLTKSLFENAGVQTSNVDDSPNICDTDCSEDLSSFNEDPTTSTSSPSDEIDTPIVELTSVQIPFKTVASDFIPVDIKVDNEIHVQLSDLELTSQDSVTGEFHPDIVELPCAAIGKDENVLRNAEFPKENPKLICKDTFTVINVTDGTSYPSTSSTNTCKDVCELAHQGSVFSKDLNTDEHLLPPVSSTLDQIISQDVQENTAPSFPSTSAQLVSSPNSDSNPKLAVKSTDQDAFSIDAPILEDIPPIKTNIVSKLTRQSTFTLLEFDLNIQDDSQITTVDHFAEEKAPDHEHTLKRDDTTDQQNLQSLEPTVQDTFIIHESTSKNILFSLILCSLY